MRKAIRASVLMLALAIPVFAGDIPYDVKVAGNIPNGVPAAGAIPYNVTLLNLLLIML